MEGMRESAMSDEHALDTQESVQTDPDFDTYKNEWLADIRRDAPSNVELAGRFTDKLLTQWLDISSVFDDLVYCDGSGDGGIDAAYLARGETADDDTAESSDGDTWYLVQSKYGSAFQGPDTLLSEGRKVIETLTGQRTRLSSLAGGLLERLQTFRAQASERDSLVLVFATEDPLNDEERRTLDHVRSMGRSKLGNIFDVDAVSIETVYQRTLDAAQSALVVPINADLVSSEQELLVGAVSLLDLYEFLKAYRAETEDLDRIYEKNVRRFLGNRGKVNKAMQQTLREEPEHFGLYNNGITLVAEDFNVREDSQIELMEPYVVNGCQTTRTIWDVLHRRLAAGGTGSDSDLEEWRKKAGEGVVVAKIVRVGTDGETLLKKITRYTNSQNAVREKDFLALTQDFRTWQNKMAERYGVYLEIQRGGWDSQRARQRQNPSLTPRFSESANAFDLLKVYGAGWLTEPGTAFGKNAPFLPEGRIFKRVVSSEESVQFGADDLFAAYQVKAAADNYQFGRGAAKPSRRITRFLFYMVVVELLRDVIVRASDNPDPGPRHFTESLNKLFQPGNEKATEALLDSAIQLVDEYMGTDGEIFKEPPFNNAFNSDFNSYLKWERFGKDEEASPRLYALIQDWRRFLGRSTGGQIPPRDVISSAISK